jgi:Ser/Thr protein kinase RdoA (MazF antagonist)
MDEVVRRVLDHYPALLAQGQLEPLGNRGGFSGARLCRLQTPTEPLCLRGSAPGESVQHVAWRHRLMAQARAAGLRYVPAVLHTIDHATFVEADGRCWELMEWLPGLADFRTNPVLGRLKAAARALALLHDAWRPTHQVRTVCPAVLRRLELARDWCHRGFPKLLAPLRPLLEGAWTMLRLWLPHVARWLEPWQTRPCVVQPCLRDVWHDHLLFQEEQLTGLVDYAAMAQDGVSADLARMLGSLVEDDDERWQIALAAYRQVRTLSAEEEALARVLDRTGVVLGLGNWLHWLGKAQGRLDLHGAVFSRVEELLRRVEQWPASSPLH